MRYNVGDKVLIKSLDWHNQMLTIKDKQAYRTPSNGCDCIGICCDNRIFKNGMIKFCGQVMTIKAIENEYYIMHEDTSGYRYCDEMIECLVERNGKLYPYKIGDRVRIKGTNKLATITDLKCNSFGNLSYYIKIDGDKDISIDYSTDLLMLYNNVEEENNDCEKCGLTRNSVRCLFMDNCPHNKQKNIIEIPAGYIFKDDNGNVINAKKIVLEKKEIKYPTTYDACCQYLGCDEKINLQLIGQFMRLLNARNTYWKLYGEEKGLGRPWEPNFTQGAGIKYSILFADGKVIWNRPECVCTTGSRILVFPTAEMRDAFYEAFKELIEECKTLL